MKICFQKKRAGFPNSFLSAILFPLKVINFLHGTQRHHFLVFDGLFEILVNLTFSYLPFGASLFTVMTPSFDRHKAQLFKYLNHLDQQDLLDIEISSQIFQLIANIKLWKLVDSLIQFGKLLSSPITCQIVGLVNIIFEIDSREILFLKNGLQQGNILRNVFTTTASLVRQIWHFSSKIQDWNPFWQDCILSTNVKELNTSTRASTIINWRAVWPFHWLTDNLTASSRFLV